MPDEDGGAGADAESARGVEHRLRRLLGAATTRFEQMRADMRELERYRTQHHSLLAGLETLLLVRDAALRRARGSNRVQSCLRVRAALARAHLREPPCALCSSRRTRARLPPITSRRCVSRTPRRRPRVRDL